MSAALDFNTADNLLSLREQTRRNEFLSSKKLLEDKIAKLEALKYSYAEEEEKKVPIYFANDQPSEKDQPPKIVRVKSHRVALTIGIPETTPIKAKKKNILPLFPEAHAFAKAERDIFADAPHTLSKNRHKVSDDYRNAKLRKKFALKYDPATGARVVTKYTSSVLHKKQLPFGSGFAASFGSTPKDGLTASEKLNGPSSSQYLVKAGMFGTSGVNFAQSIAWDEIRDTDWSTQGGRFDLRLRMMSDHDQQARKMRKQLREQKLRGAAVLEARQEMRETLDIGRRMEKKHGRTPRREVDKKSVMQFRYTERDGTIRTTVAAPLGESNAKAKSVGMERGLFSGEPYNNRQAPRYN
jgi:hypothetical protein